MQTAIVRPRTSPCDHRRYGRLCYYGEHTHNAHTWTPTQIETLTSILGRARRGSPGWHANLFGSRRRPAVITSLFLLPRRAVRGSMSRIGRVGERRSALNEGRDGLGAGPEGRPESRHGHHHAARHHGWNDEREIHPSTRALRHTDAKRGSFKAVFPTLLPSKSRHRCDHTGTTRACRS